jgi:hypothetical protein
MENKLNISTTTIKAFKGDDYCAAQLYATLIAKTHKSIPSLAMLKGSYFETLCLGEGAKGEKVTDIPRLKSGEMSVDQQRIIKQSEAFHDMVKERPIVIEQKQIEIIIPYNDKYNLKGYLDFIGMVEPNELAIADLKLTGSINREHNYDGFGPWSWRFPQNYDFTQAYFYEYLVEEQFDKKLPFYYLVYDYKPESESLIIRKKIERMHRLELMQSIVSTIDKIEYHTATGWKERPSYRNCQNCPLKETCPVKDLKKPINTI